jgi:L-asparaginase
MKKRISIIFTGGTIAMKIDPSIHAAIPALNAEEIIETVKNIKDMAEIDVVNFSNIPSPHIDFDILMDLYSLVKAKIEDDKTDAVIITHGTDTLEETAYLLDLLLNTKKPVILVGAMRNFSELGYDGSSNLSAAICTALSPNSIDKGVLVVMNNEINAASEVTKTNTLSLDTFKSPEFGPLGIVDNDEALYYRNIIQRQHINTDKIETKIGLLKCCVGMDADIIDYYINNNYKGLIIEALGRGNVPPILVPGIKRALSNNMIVGLVSRCNTGRVLYTYGYEGGGKHLRNLGVIFGGNLPGQKARIKLCAILGYTQDKEKIKNLFEKNYNLID